MLATLVDKPIVLVAKLECELVVVAMCKCFDVGICEMDFEYHGHGMSGLWVDLRWLLCGECLWVVLCYHSLQNC